MKGFVKKTLGLLLTGGFSVILAACYGPPVDMNYTKTVKAKSDTGEPIEGLKISVLNGSDTMDSGITNSQGMTTFYETGFGEFVIEDIDGEANGGKFRKTIVEINQTEYYEITVAKE